MGYCLGAILGLIGLWMRKDGPVRLPAILNTKINKIRRVLTTGDEAIVSKELINPLRVGLKKVAWDLLLLSVELPCIPASDDKLLHIGWMQ